MDERWRLAGTTSSPSASLGAFFFVDTAFGFFAYQLKSVNVSDCLVRKIARQNASKTTKKKDKH
jgi:hypothetical protein